MSKSYNILSEKYQSILENDKEDILAGLTALDDDNKAKRALAKVAENIKQLNLTKYSSRMIWGTTGYAGHRNINFSINSTPHGFRLRVTRFPKFEKFFPNDFKAANFSKDTYIQEIIDIIKNVFQEAGIPNRVKYRFRNVPEQLDVWYERPGSAARPSKYIEPVM